jgi:hypothetical protein
MDQDQIKLLSSLAQKIHKEEKNREKIVSTLQSAKILTKNENLTTHYSNLSKVVLTSK